MSKPSLSAWIRRLGQRAQRGATATGYALIVATLITASLAVLQSLQANSGEFLADTGSEVGTPRLPREQVVTSLLPPAPAYVPPTLPLTLITYDAESIGVADHGANMCMDFVAGVVSWAQCGTSPNEISLTASYNDPDFSLSMGGGLCLEAGATNIIAASCSGTPLQDWIQVDVVDPVTGDISDKLVMYQLQGTAQCIRAVPAPPAVQGDPGFTLSPCGSASVLEILF